jgi:hypothetical protein
MKKCIICLQQFNLSNFYGRSAKCKSCQKNHQKLWVKNNIEKTKEYIKKFKSNNLAKYKQQQRDYCIRNRELLSHKSNEWKKNNRKYWNEYIKNYKVNNPNYRISESHRQRIRDALNGSTKHDSSKNLLGCSYEELRIYLECKFKKGMNWNNYGFGNDKWHIDHIKPCASFDLTKESEQRLCFHYTNLQPLWQHENLVKGDSYHT